VRRVVSGDQVLAEATHEPGQMRCLAVMTSGEEKRRCQVRIQRTAEGDLLDGVRQHYQKVHPEKGIR
jgi:hypothetical protein